MRPPRNLPKFTDRAIQNPSHRIPIRDNSFSPADTTTNIDRPAAKSTGDFHPAANDLRPAKSPFSPAKTPIFPCRARFDSARKTSMQVKPIIAILTASIAAFASAAGAQTTVNLYTGSGTQTPQSQGWLNFIPEFGTPSVSSAAGATILDTTSSDSIMAGYFNFNSTLTAFQNASFPTLNPAVGFSVNFNLQINSESHTGANGANRAGFSVIALGSDDTGIELGFWPDDIWAQSTTPTLFTHGEDATFNTESAAQQYSLTIQGSAYTLSADGTPILTGPTRNYSSFGLPYTLPNFLFLGDDTTAAEASETFSSVSVTVPEPVSLAGMGACLMAGLARRRSRK